MNAHSEGGSSWEKLFPPTPFLSIFPYLGERDTKMGRCPSASRTPRNSVCGIMTFNYNKDNNENQYLGFFFFLKMNCLQKSVSVFSLPSNKTNIRSSRSVFWYYFLYEGNKIDYNNFGFFSCLLSFI